MVNFMLDKENYIFTRELVVDLFLIVFMARGREKERQKNDKSEVLPSGVGGVHDIHQGIRMMRSVTLILGCCLVLILRNNEWNELTGHPQRTVEKTVRIRGQILSNLGRMM
jgi:hypothetical protein